MSEPAQIGIRRIYLKDLSFESPTAPELFNKEFQPEVKMDVTVRHKNLENNVYEIVVAATVTGNQDGKKIFIVEVEQGGIFEIRGVPAEQMEHALKVYCPNILFPYTRQVIDIAMNQGSLPSMLLPPFNFESLARPPQRD